MNRFGLLVLVLPLVMADALAQGQPAGKVLARVWTQAAIDSAVAAHRQVLVDFSATWCGPCRRMEPDLATVEKEGKITVVRVDVDANKPLAGAHGVYEIPTLLAFKNGKQVLRMEGQQTAKMLREAFR